MTWGGLRFSRRARVDLLDLWSHVAERDPSQADDILDCIEAGFHVRQNHPRFGRARPDIGEDARMLVIGRWLALYRMMGNDVQIVRVVDGVRDLKQLEWTRSPSTEE